MTNLEVRVYLLLVGRRRGHVAVLISAGRGLSENEVAVLVGCFSQFYPASL